MPKVTPVQNAVIDIMDFIHFKNVYTSLFLSNEQTKACLVIFSLVEEVTNRICSSLIERDILNHYLLCGIEVALSNDEIDTFNIFGNVDNMSYEELEKLINKRTEISISTLSNLAEKNGINKAVFLNSLEYLLAKEEIANTSSAIRFRLASKTVSIIHPLDSILFFNYLNDLGILYAAKYNAKISREESKCAFIRVGLLMEFEILRSNVKYIAGPGGSDELIIKAPPKGTSSIVCRDMADNYKYLIDVLFSNTTDLFWFQALHMDHRKSANYLLINVNRLFRHKRLFKGTFAKWPGTLGVFLMSLIKKENANQPIYCESDNKGSVSEKACRELERFDITLSERTLYLRYRKILKNEYLKVRFYCEQCAKLNYYLPWDYEDLYYNDAVLLDI